MRRRRRIKRWVSLLLPVCCLSLRYDLRYDLHHHPPLTNHHPPSTNHCYCRKDAASQGRCSSIWFPHLPHLYAPSLPPHSSQPQPQPEADNSDAGSDASESVEHGAGAHDDLGIMGPSDDETSAHVSPHASPTRSPSPTTPPGTRPGTPLQSEEEEEVRDAWVAEMPYIVKLWLRRGHL